MALFDINDKNASQLSVTLTELGIKGNYRVKDLWTKQDKGLVKDQFPVSLDSHASMLVRFSRTK